MSANLYAELPFITRRLRSRLGGYDYWSVKSTGNLQADWDLGRDYGRAFIRFIRKSPTYGNLNLLNLIVSSMVDHGAASEAKAGWRSNASGIRGGFLTAVAGELILSLGLTELSTEPDHATGRLLRALTAASPGSERDKVAA